MTTCSCFSHWAVWREWDGHRILRAVVGQRSKTWGKGPVSYYLFACLDRDILARCCCPGRTRRTRSCMKRLVWQTCIRFATHALKCSPFLVLPNGRHPRRPHVSEVVPTTFGVIPGAWKRAQLNAHRVASVEGHQPLDHADVSAAFLWAILYRSWQQPPCRIAAVEAIEPNPCIVVGGEEASELCASSYRDQSAEVWAAPVVRAQRRQQLHAIPLIPDSSRSRKMALLKNEWVMRHTG